MPLINRFTRLFTADLNAVLDRIEEPDVLLRQSVREMEAELCAMHQQLRALAYEHEHAAERERVERASMATLDDELDMCFAAGEEALTRNLVKRKLEADQRLRNAVASGALAARQAERTEATIAEASRKLDAMREKRDVLLDDEALSAAGTPLSPGSISNEELDIAWLREKQRRAGA